MSKETAEQAQIDIAKKAADAAKKAARAKDFRDGMTDGQFFKKALNHEVEIFSMSGNTLHGKLIGYDTFDVVISVIQNGKTIKVAKHAIEYISFAG